MEITFTGHGIDITDAIRDFATSKLERLDRHCEHIMNVNLTLSVEKLRQIAEATVHVPGENFHAEAAQENLYSAIDELMDKLDRQLKRYKEKQKDHHKGIDIED